MNTLPNILGSLGFEICKSVIEGMMIYLLLLGISRYIPGITAAVKSTLSMLGLLFLFFLFVRGVWPVIGNAIMEHQANAYQTSSLSNGKFPLLSHESPGKLLFYLGLVYCFGVIVTMIKMAYGYYALIQLKRGMKLTPPRSWEASLVRLRQELNVRQKVSMYCSELVNTPVLYGFIKPVILIPASFITQFNLFEIEDILIHELHHVKRLDYLFQIVINVIQVVLFINPFVYFLVKEINLARECDCDDKVISIRADSVAYAETLLKLAQYRKYGMLVTTFHINADNNQLFNRIKRITTMKTSTKNYSSAIVMSFAFLCIATLISWSSSHTANYPTLKRERIKFILASFQRTHTLKVPQGIVVKTSSQEYKQPQVKLAANAISNNDRAIRDTSNSKTIPSQISEIRKIADSIKTIFDYSKPDYHKTFAAIDTANNPQWTDQKHRLKLYYEHIGSILTSKDYQKNISQLLKQSEGNKDGYYLNQ